MHGAPYSTYRAASVDYAMRQGIQIFCNIGEPWYIKNRSEGAWEMSGSVREGDRQAVMRENKISKEVAVDSNRESKGEDDQENIGNQETKEE
jgi:hypothetical protein